MSIQNMREYSTNYSETTGRILKQQEDFEDEATDFDADIADTNNIKSFKYKTKLIGDTAAAN